MRQAFRVLSIVFASLLLASASSAAGATAGKKCGGIIGTTCAAKLYCDFGPSCGAGDQRGKCKKKPTVCPQSSLTTGACGCDGHGYTTACSAARAGVSVKSSGPCPGRVGTACGSRGLPRCAIGLYCKFDSGCGADDRGGKCTAKPTVCPQTSLTTSACGCDGHGYPHACHAAARGVSVKSSGPCPGQVGAACGSRGLPPCADVLFCKFESGCGADDRGGKCTEKPTVCPQSSLTTGACGCDGHGYPTACQAHKAGVSLKNSGPCQ